MEWSPWISFSEVGHYRIPAKPGVYEIRCVSGRGKPFEIYRAYGVDEHGILSIGESLNLSDRLHGFWRTIQPHTKRSSHAAGWYYVSLGYNHVFKKEKLQFKYKVTETKKQAQKEEFILLCKYRSQFLDLPPLNNNLGKYPKRGWKKIMKAITGIDPLEG